MVLPLLDPSSGSALVYIRRWKVCMRRPSFSPVLPALGIQLYQCGPLGNAAYRTAADNPLAKKLTVLSWILYW